MENFDLLAKRLAIDSRIQKLMNKGVKIPAYLDDFNSLDRHWYPHPPCLIPLFLGYGASYKGIVNHFFCDRKPTFAEYLLEHGYIAEIARNSDQFITLMVLKMIITKDELTDEIISFCKQLDYHHYTAVEEFVFDYGDDPKEFDKLVFFDNNRPFKYLKSLSAYNGDFPSSIHILNSHEMVRNASIFEIAVDEQLSEVPNLPPWLIKDNDKKALFDTFVNDNKLKEAWFTLNANGWLLRDVVEALQKLKDKANNDLFTLVADNWIFDWKRSNYSSGSY
jgi:hypothetical protein